MCYGAKMSRYEGSPEDTTIFVKNSWYSSQSVEGPTKEESPLCDNSSALSSRAAVVVVPPRLEQKVPHPHTRVV